MKYAWIDKQQEFSLAEMCTILDVSVSGYRSWKRGGKPDRKRLTDTQMLTLIQSTHAELKGIYGSPRMVRELRDRGFPACKKRVERLMRENDIRARHKRRYKVTTDSKHNLPIAPNLLDRNFSPTAPNQVWTSDITYLWTDEGWLYLAIVLDLFNREVVGWLELPPLNGHIMFCLKEKKYDTKLQTCLPTGVSSADGGIGSIRQLPEAIIQGIWLPLHFDTNLVSSSRCTN